MGFLVRGTADVGNWCVVGTHYTVSHHVGRWGIVLGSGYVWNCTILTPIVGGQVLGRGCIRRLHVVVRFFPLTILQLHGEVKLEDKCKQERTISRVKQIIRIKWDEPRPSSSKIIAK